MKFSSVTFSSILTIVAYTSANAQQVPYFYNVENAIVLDYLYDTNTKYSNSIGREGASVLNYYDYKSDYISRVPKSASFLPQWSEQPAQISLTINSGAKIQVDTNPIFSNPKTFPITNKKAVIVNLIPQEIYWYRILSSSNQTLSEGTFKTGGHERMLKLGHILNVRDIGGWPTIDKNGNVGRLAYNKIIRGATLDGTNDATAKSIDSNDKTILTTFAGVGAEVDLRGDTDQKQCLIDKTFPFLKVDMAYYRYALTNTYCEDEYQDENGVWHDKEIYTGKYYEEIRKCFEFIKNNLENGKGIYVHCSIGADRTGTIIALLEALCGVSEADIVKDWEMTSFTTRLEQKPTKMERIIDYPTFGFYYQDGKVVKRRDGELRSFFDYLYTENNIKEGKSLQEKVENWLKLKIFSKENDKGVSIINSIRNNLVISEKESPTLIISWRDKNNSKNKYSVVKENQTDYDQINNKQFLLASTNEVSETSSDMFCITDTISCSNYSSLFSNIQSNTIAMFYDKDQKFIDALIDQDIPKETIRFKTKEYPLDKYLNKGAKYVRFNIPKNCDWTVVLSNKKYL